MDADGRPGRTPRYLALAGIAGPDPALREAVRLAGGELIEAASANDARARLHGDRFDALVVELGCEGSGELAREAAEADACAVLACAQPAGTPGEHLPSVVELVAPAAGVAERARALARAVEALAQRRELADARAQLERAHRFARIGSFEIDWNAQDARCSPQALRLFGLPAEAACLALAELARQVAGARADAWIAWCAAVADGSPRSAFEQRLQRQDGGERIVRIHAERTTDPRTGCVALKAIVHDVTDRRRVEEELEYQARHDDLTGLANRRQLLESLEKALDDSATHGGWVAVLFLDLDRFKDVNESLGHAAGDKLLVEVAARLRHGIRDDPREAARETARDLIARPGGDEFAVLLCGLKCEADAAAVAHRLQAAFDDPVQLDGRDIFLTTCVGYSAALGGLATPRDLVKQAETAMYSAKESGRSASARFEPSMIRCADQRLEMETALRRALERHEFEVWYQPRVELASARVVGFEALVRWRHPQHGLVAPAEFIPLAEESGLIVPLGAWVLRDACRQVEVWRKAGFRDVRLAVNVSAEQFRDRQLVVTVAEALAASGLPADALELELTESTLMRDVDRALETLHRLAERGVQLAIDDFGTGYSSLAYLKRLPIDCLKIDRSFVKDIPGDAGGAAITSLIVMMAHRLRLDVVAEGVETEAQAEYLRGERCDQAQGYLFGRPTPAAEALALLERQLVLPSA